jgi:hypothetical protein
MTLGQETLLYIFGAGGIAILFVYVLHLFGIGTL